MDRGAHLLVFAEKIQSRLPVGEVAHRDTVELFGLVQVHPLFGIIHAEKYRYPQFFLQDDSLEQLEQGMKAEK